MKKGGNKKRCYTEGWVEFSDKRIAKRVALSLNCTKMGNLCSYFQLNFS